MKKTLVIIVIILIGKFSYAQIEADLLLGLTPATTAEMNAISNPPLGALIYNTSDFSIYQYGGGSWIRVFDSANNGSTGSKMNFGGRWTNTDVATNLNVNAVVAPIFGNEDYKDDGNALYEVSGNTLIVKANGRYEIKANLSMLTINSNGSTEARTNANARIAVNGTATGARAASGYVRFANGHAQSSLHMNEILELNANDVISIIMFREANSGTVRFSGANESSIMINKLK